MGDLIPIVNSLYSRAAEFEAGIGDQFGSKARMQALAGYSQYMNKLISWQEERHHNDVVDPKGWDVLTSAGKESRSLASSLGQA